MNADQRFSLASEDSWPREAGQSWRGLYRTAGIAAIVFVALLISALVIDFIAPPPVHGGAETLEFIAANKQLYIAEQTLWILPSILPVVVFAALFVALAPLGRSAALVAAIAGGLPWALLLAVPVSSRGSLSLVYLSDRYSSAGSEAERRSFAAAAEAIVAENNTPAIAGMLSPVGIFLISLVMLRGVLPRAVAWLGILTGSLGVISEALRFVAPEFYWGYGVLLWIWFVSVGINLLRLQPDPQTPEPQESHRVSTGLGFGFTLACLRTRRRWNSDSRLFRSQGIGSCLCGSVRISILEAVA